MRQETPANNGRHHQCGTIADRGEGNFCWRRSCLPLRRRALQTPALAQDYEAIVAAPDRSDADRQADKRRDPVKLLAFIGVRPGMKVLDMGTGAGYSTELMARAVGPPAMSTARIPPRPPNAPATRFDQRLKTPAMKNVTRPAPRLRRSGAGRCAQSRPHHVSVLLSRHHVHEGRPRGDEQAGCSRP